MLDEPFSGLDPIAMAAMADLLAEVAAAGATVLFSSHQLDLVEDLCEDVVIIDHGRIVLAGELTELRAPCRNDSWTSATGGSRPTGRRLPSVEVVEPRTDMRGCRSTATPISQRSWPPPGAAREVVSFAYQPPTLSELFRQAVAA